VFQSPFGNDPFSKPVIKAKVISPWKEDIKALAKYENVCCKLSGMVTETHRGQWKPNDFKP
jgi:L-fuconolactonase